MKQLLLLCALLCANQTANAQFFTIPDTLLIQNFTIDPSDTMLLFPSGNDNRWVNWDADNLPTLCGEEIPVPGNWFWENDLGDLTDPPVNFAFTSCSFLVENDQPNQNWLITPPVFISDSTATLNWRSSPFEGPAYMDGYKVLVSTTTNEPFENAFTDTLFVAAEMTDVLKAGSLKVEDHLFSPGYIHADGYTDTDYFFLIHPTAKSYTGRLEPRTASLAKFAGRWIYIAFLHDSTDDSILQIDDIAVVQDHPSSTASPTLFDVQLQMQPNPAGDFTSVTWRSISAREGQLILTDILGKTVLVQALDNLSSGSARLELQGLPPGTYSCTLRTAEGRQTRLLVKR